MTFRSLVWLRDDLRLADNPALNAAVAQGGRVAALYMLEQAPGLRPLGGAVSWWLGKSLASVGRSLDAAGIELQVQTGDPRQIVPAAAQRLGVTNVLWNRRYAPAAREIDSALKIALQDGGMAATSFPGNVFLEPWNIKTGSGGAFQVYTPFARVVRQLPIAFPLPNPVPGDREPSREGVAAWSFQPKWC